MAAQDRSPKVGDPHQAAVREPPADPSERHVMVAERTMIWPLASFPRGPPKSATRRSRASLAPSAGQGWFARQVPSISRAATPAIRILIRSSAHQTGPSPSYTAIGVHRNVTPGGTTAECASAGGRKFQPMSAIAKRMRKPLIRSRSRRDRDRAWGNSQDRRRAPARLQPLSPPRNCGIAGLPGAPGFLARSWKQVLRDGRP
jgi:hypothetical protein